MASQKHFSRGAKSSEISFYPPETKKKLFCTKNSLEKYQISTSKGKATPSPFRRT